jgi:dTDP-4-amino-4,6-dideoxygalactose transaminase
MLRLCQPQISSAAISAVVDVLQSGQLVHGAEGQAFETELASYLGTDHAVLVSSGTAALHLALMALDLGPGDAVLVPDFTFPATGNVVSQVGARVVLVDVDPQTYTLDLAALERRLQSWSGPERLRAVMPVHEFGAPVAMEALLEMAQRHNVHVIEDAACALGAEHQGRRLGTWGQMGCFSFHPRKTLTTGEGGLICTADAALAERLRSLRSHGMVRCGGQVHFGEPGLNYRLTDLQAALGRHQLPYLDGWIARRRELAARYRCELAGLQSQSLLRLPVDQPGHSYQTFMVVLAPHVNRSVLIEQLAAAGIEANLGAQSLSALGLYGPSLPMQTGPALYRHGLAIPLHETMQDGQLSQVCVALEAALATA